MFAAMNGTSLVLMPWHFIGGVPTFSINLGKDKSFIFNAFVCKVGFEVGVVWTFEANGAGHVGSQIVHPIIIKNLLTRWRIW